MATPDPAFHTILVALDGSTFAEQALPVAAAIARSAHAELALVRVHAPPGLAVTHAFEWDNEVRQRERAYLDDVSRRVQGGLGALPERLVVDGHAPEAIAEVARHRDAPLLVIGSHGRTGPSRFWLGSVAQAVIGQAAMPVLMVRVREAEGGAAAPTPPSIQKMLIPLDGSREAEAVLAPALELAAVTGASVLLLRVIAPRDLPEAPRAAADDATQAMLRRLEADLLSVAARTAPAFPAGSIAARVAIADSAATAIIDTAQHEGCALVAMTTRAAGRPVHLLGSVADKVIRAGPPLLLLVRPST